MELILNSLRENNVTDAYDQLISRIHLNPYRDNPFFHFYAGLIQFSMWDTKRRHPMTMSSVANDYFALDPMASMSLFQAWTKQQWQWLDTSDGYLDRLTMLLERLFDRIEYGDWSGWTCRQLRSSELSAGLKPRKLKYVRIDSDSDSEELALLSQAWKSMNISSSSSK
ncbi:hypothetical protein SYNPS1DRAFT_24432 [Syncephalis pseudoplumigaleata]|uniref:Uncharacterized protein n=1 Tax=Syncephalis pseudoplumigaleata TaxID=1712513 RepID=A0A4P9YX40_9FUNG|nr:hypothetical protein SYNPS1DRAFT_24432 [Syncephalis pseudoplumigaleata]|eukprot:RKP23510.1 hypothetical protein SYNPS1DRAFT_24432 [Syncephalis pseudoplumigaleata]